MLPGCGPDGYGRLLSSALFWVPSGRVDEEVAAGVEGDTDSDITGTTGSVVTAAGAAWKNLSRRRYTKTPAAPTSSSNTLSTQ